MMDTPRWRRYLRFWRPDVDGDVEDELRFHFESRIAELRARGVPADDAKRQVLAEFGDESATRERLLEIGRRREARRTRMEWWDATRSDLRYALRGFRTSPLLTATIVGTLAIGIGATTAMYGVMRRLMIAPPPHVASPETLHKLYFRAERDTFPSLEPANVGDSATIYYRLSYPFYEQLRAQRRTLSGVAGYIEAWPLVVGSGRDARTARATMVSAGFWTTLGVAPLAGRFITDDESHPATGARVAVLGHAFWRERFGGDRSVIGRTLAVKGIPYTVIGIAPRGFRGIDLGETDVWLPLLAYADGDGRPVTWHTRPTSYRLSYVARRRPGSSRAQVEADLSAQFHAHMRDVARAIPDAPPGMFPPTTVLLGDVTGALDGTMTRVPEATVSVWLVGVAGLLLAIACANVAGLLLLRALRRRREIAVRLALGMSRRRLAALLFTESGLVALLGAIASVVVIVWGGAWVERVMLTNIASESPGFDWRTLGSAATCAIGAMLVAGLVPLLQIRGEITAGLREGSQYGSARRSWTHRTLLIAQTTLSVILLVGAGLFVRSLYRITSLDLGLDARNVLTVSVDFTATGSPPRDRRDFFETALARIRALPGVESASMAAQAPLRGASAGSFRLSGADAPVMSPDRTAPWKNSVGDGFFESTGMRIVRGRGLTSEDRTGPPTLVVNEAMAALAWPGGSGVGECVYTDALRDRCTTVVGVVANARSFRIQEEQRPWIYVPLASDYEGNRVLLVKVAPSEVERMVGVVRRAVQELESDAPFVDVRVLGDILDPQMRPWRMGAALFTAFGVMAALLAALGLYSAVAYAVTQRTREIGVRLAIGARVASVVKLVVGDGLRITLVGVALGLVAAVVISGSIADLLFETSPRDPLVLLAVAGGLIVLAVLASLLPARRAARVSPSVALRVE
jgi:predicted permease